MACRAIREAVEEGSSKWYDQVKATVNNTELVFCHKMVDISEEGSLQMDWTDIACPIQVQVSKFSLLDDYNAEDDVTFSLSLSIFFSCAPLLVGFL